MAHQPTRQPNLVHRARRDAVRKNAAMVVSRVGFCLATWRVRSSTERSKGVPVSKSVATTTASMATNASYQQFRHPRRLRRRVSSSTRVRAASCAGEQRVGGDHGGVELGVVGEHLFGVGGGTLITWVGVRGRCGAAEIVVEQHESDVVPVLRQATAASRCRLGEEEPGQTADVHIDGEQIAADLPAQSSSGTSPPSTTNSGRAP